MPDKTIEVLLNELTGLNNELVNTQRSLVKKNTEIEKLNQRLTSANLELEEFTYVASHDLKEPLRMVRLFMEKLEKGYALQLDEKAKKYIHFAIDGANRMTALIDELLAYAKIGSDESTKELTDINSVLDEIIKMQQGVVAENGATVKHGPMPIIMAFKTPVKILFQNLISNGLKYIPKGVIPEIKVSCIEKSDEWQFDVTDNGIGISPENHEQIFQLFKRLHTREEYAGTGMGLATCKKIAEKHGGEIWVESEEARPTARVGADGDDPVGGGKGSTFYFTIKK